MELVLRLIYEKMCNATCQCSTTGSQTILLESLTEQAGGKGGALVLKRADGNPVLPKRAEPRSNGRDSPVRIQAVWAYHP